MRVLVLSFFSAIVITIYSFQNIYQRNSPGGPFETWGYHERFGKRIPAWQFLGIDKEQWNKVYEIIGLRLRLSEHSNVNNPC